jgi:DNA-binding transcriptional regulator YhcF (GntR family)
MGGKSRDDQAGPPGPNDERSTPAPIAGTAASQRASAEGTAAATTASGAAAAGSLDITRGSDVPISTQLYWQLAYQVDSGRLHAGARLPTVRELGAVLHVNPNTVRSVYRRLAEAGYVVSRQGAGTRVAGETAEQYIRTSIQQPNAFIVSDDPVHNFTGTNGKSLMPEGLGNLMSDQDLADLLAYLLTLQ